MGGLGSDTRKQVNKQLVEMLKDSSKTEKAVSKMEGIGMEDLKYIDQRKKLVMINYLKEKIDQQKAEKKDKKKAKKEAKRKKKDDKKLKKRKRSASSEREAEKKPEVRKHRSRSRDDKRDHRKRERTVSREVK